MSNDIKVNDQNYWDHRFETDWQECDGPGQTNFFAELLMNNIPQWLLAEIRKHKLTFCDWGCAEGDAVVYLAQFLGRDMVKGIDFSDVAIDKAKRKYVDYQFSAEDWIESLPEKENRHDVVFSSNTLEHFHDPIVILKNIIGKVARKYIVLLIPYAEDPQKMEEEHFFRFESYNIPACWDNWSCVHFNVINTLKLENTRWRGQQTLLVFGNKSWMAKTNIQVQLDAITGDAAFFEEKSGALAADLEKNKLELLLFKQRLETQMLHDKILLKQNESLTGELQSTKGELQSTKGELQSAKGELQSAKGELQSAKGELQSAKGELQSAKELYQKLEEINKRLQEADIKLSHKDTELAILRNARDELNHLKQLRSYRLIAYIKRILLQLGFYKCAGRKFKTNAPASKPKTISNASQRNEQQHNNQTGLHVSSQKVVPPPRNIESQRAIKIASILDTFTHACFEPETQLIPFRPDNWQDILSGNDLDMLLVESAWHGNDGAWQYRVGTYSASPGRELYDVIDWCRKEGLPTVFWNKEDPPHFEQFIEAAKAFDYVFTTDENCIPKYRELCGHDRVFALPFAAQPTIHNPVLNQDRNHDVCFAGTYYANRFDERRDEMVMLLRAARDYDFEIFDRMHGYVGAGSENYRFPEEFQKFIRGRLEYDDMVKAYRQYKVFLNVNSIANSKTMFSRRVFELLACGTPVVSTHSIGIEHFFGDIVPLVVDEKETRDALRQLITDADHWSRTSAKGIRLVMDQHIYEKRLATVCDVIGFSPAQKTGPPVLAILTSGGNPDRIAASLKAQTKQIDSAFVVHGGKADDVLVKRLLECNIKAECLAAGDLLGVLQRDDNKNAKILFVSSNDTYGPNYVKDAIAALNYSGLKLTGMSSYFSWDGKKIRYNEDNCPEYQISRSVIASTLAAKKEAVSLELIQQFTSGGNVQLETPCYSRARYEYACCTSENSIPDYILNKIIL